MNEKYDNYNAPQKSAIRKLGTIKCDVVETTPVVFHDRLYRLEYFRAHKHNESNSSETTHLHFVDTYTNQATKPFAQNHHFGTAFVDGDFMYVSATADSGIDKTYDDWGGDTVNIFRSADLENWELYGSLAVEGNNIFNTGLCKLNHRYTMLLEVAKPIQFCFRFAQSTDLKHWTLLPEDFFFQKGRYAGGPAIYTLPDDPHYYVLYLEANPGPCYTNCIARSKNLIDWEYSPINPVLMFDAHEDKKIANPYLTKRERDRIERALDINNSDLELCEFLGRTILYYSWGCQQGIEFLAEACYEGSMKDFLQGFFDS
ncbi:MAG: hypothetical protein VB070_11910 [Clostridiaceae bacterium]|nr:hypothetical protein [Clostridiaceae bacterium]